MTEAPRPGERTRVLLLCHAATPATRAARFPLDEPIEDMALERLRRHPPRLPRHDRCLTSPAAAAQDTAAALGLSVVIDAGLVDWEAGRWAGQTLAEVHAADPGGVAAWLHDPFAAPHGGPPLVDVLARVGRWLDAQAGQGGSVLAVTHPAVLRAAMVQALDAPASAFWRLDAAPLSVLELSGRAKRWTVTRLGPA